MRCLVLSKLFTVVALTGAAGVALAQQPEPTTRQAAIEQGQAEKLKTLHPYVPSKGERLAAKIENILNGEGKHLHPFFESAYSGGGFAFGPGYTQHVSGYNFVDVRGSYSLSNYKRAEIEFVAPRLFHRRGELSLLGGWRDATQVGFYGLGIDTSKDDRTNYRFQRPYASGLLTLWPTRRNLLLRGGAEWTRWSQEPGLGRFPSVDTRYTPATLPGLGADPAYVHTQATVGFDWRTSPGYSRRGGYYGITGHDYYDRDKAFGFQQVDYEAIQHVPVLRETWVFSFHALARTTIDRGGQVMPFFMMPYLGGSSTLRGYTSLRFRDRNSLLLQGEWRIMASRYLDSAVFFDAGKVTARRSDLDFDGLKHDYGFGLRFHGPISTPLRVELARGSDGLTFVVATSAVF
jgi:surface antigen Omp85-like protein